MDKIVYAVGQDAENALENALHAPVEQSEYVKHDWKRAQAQADFLGNMFSCTYQVYAVRISAEIVEG